MRFAIVLLILLLVVCPVHAQGGYGTEVRSVSAANLAGFLERSGYTTERFNDGSCIIRVDYQGTRYTIRALVSRDGDKLWLQTILGKASVRNATPVLALNTQVAPSYFNQSQDGTLNLWRPLSTINLDGYGLQQGLKTLCNQVQATSGTWKSAVAAAAPTNVRSGAVALLDGRWISAKNVAWQIRSDGSGRFTATLSNGPGRAPTTGSASGTYDGTNFRGQYELSTQGQHPIRGTFAAQIGGNVLSGRQSYENTAGQRWQDAFQLTRTP